MRIEGINDRHKGEPGDNIGPRYCDHVEDARLSGDAIFEKKNYIYLKDGEITSNSMYGSDRTYEKMSVQKLR